MRKNVVAVNLLVVVAFVAGFLAHNRIIMLGRWVQINFDSITANSLPEIGVRDTFGDDHRLDELYSGEKRIVFFWSGSCGYCEMLIKYLDDNSDTLSADQIRIIGILLDKNPEKAYSDFLWSSYYLPEADDIDQIRKDNKLISVPVVFIVDERNRLVSRIVGFQEEGLKKALTEL